MQADLIQQISATIGKSKVLNLSRILAEDNTDLAELIDLTFYHDKAIAFRASWLLENMYYQNPDAFIPHIDHLIRVFRAVSNPSCQRHYAKIMMLLTSPKAPPSIRQKIRATNLEPVIEQCFDWMIDPQVMVAVKAHASEALFNMRLRYPWITDELPGQLQFLMRDGTPAIQTRGRRLLSYLDPEKWPV